MTEKAFNQIAEGLNEALAVARIERFEKAVRANGYRTCDNSTEVEYEEAKLALTSALSTQVTEAMVERFQREYVAVSYEYKWVDAGSHPDDETSRRLLHTALGSKP